MRAYALLTMNQRTRKETSRVWAGVSCGHKRSIFFRSVILCYVFFGLFTQCALLLGWQIFPMPLDVVQAFIGSGQTENVIDFESETIGEFQ